MSVETPNRIQAQALFAPIVAPPFSDTMIASKGVQHFVRIGVGQYIVVLEQPIAFVEGYALASLPPNSQQIIDAQILPDNTVFVSVLTLGTGVPVDPPWFSFLVMRWNEGQGTGPTVPALPIPPPIPGGGGAPFQTDVVIAGAGQTNFPLSMLPFESQNVRMSVNGQLATPGIDYTCVLNVVTWLNTDYSMSAGDEVVFFYEV